jgi:hypothetical protein
MLMERYMTISFMRYSTAWLARPVVIVLLAFAALVFFAPLFKLLSGGGTARLRPSGKVVLKLEDLAYVFFIGIGVCMLVSAQGWLLLAKIGPTVIASILVIAATISLAYKVFFTQAQGGAGATQGIHMDVASDHGEGLSTRVALTRAARFFGWFLAFLGCMSVIGMIPTVPLMIVAFMRIEGRERWRLSLIVAVCVTALVYVIFDQIIHIPWPGSLLGQWFPALDAGA